MLGAYLGWEIDPWIEARFKAARSGLGVLIGALVGNTISDCAGAILDPDMRVMVFGITNGCLIPLLFVPLIEKMKARREPASRDEAINKLWDGSIVVTLDSRMESLGSMKIAEDLHAESLAEVVEDPYGYGSLYGEEGDSWLNNVKPISEWGRKEPASEEVDSDHGRYLAEGDTCDECRRWKDDCCCS
jgi:hypothetical protein